MSKIAFIYPGQGAQVCGMGQDFYEQTKAGKETFDPGKRDPPSSPFGALLYGE